MNIKKELLIGLVILIAVLTILFVSRLFEDKGSESLQSEPVNRGNNLDIRSQNDNTVPSDTGQDPNQPVSNSNQNSEVQKEYTFAEISSHSVPQDCWVVINGLVYDLSGFNNQHPGGQAPIEFNCGKDGTQAFTTRMGKGPHPESAAEYLKTRLIGVVSE